MNHNEITSMAREAGLFVPRAGLPENGALIRFFHAAYAAGVTAEREAILQMSREQWFKTQADFEEAIRARSQQ